MQDSGWHDGKPNKRNLLIQGQEECHGANVSTKLKLNH